ncbi:hypothetical protein [Flavobacterium sp. 1355]|uniref:hypothetical protein n=1 Tax=Flavobacterium sp. 1355 TaxID=2806571 RepID=UPI001AE5B3FC|nr:hypothetical protein [Flavobacterium sp. 1355]MBP1225354.1 hypothetical protein [Flavobacterium sp. 1355]
MKKSISFLLLLLIFSSCDNSKKVQINDTPLKENAEDPVKKELIINILSIVGKNKTQVEKVLGKAENEEKIRPSDTPCEDKGCDKLIYKKSKYEVVFINDKADWITIYNVSEFDTSVEGIELLGLKLTEPDFNSPRNVIRWKNIENIKEINFFDNGSGKLDYIYIHGQTE